MGHLPPWKWKQSRAKAVENTVESGGKLKLGFKKERKNGVSTAMGKIFLKIYFKCFVPKSGVFIKIVQIRRKETGIYVRFFRKRPNS